MKILFIYSLDSIQSKEKPITSWQGIQFGISYISSVLKDSGYQTQLLVLGSAEKKTTQLLDVAIEEFDPTLIGFTSVSSQYPFIESMASYTKEKYPDKYLLLGGVHATLNPQEAINGPFDAICIGEGEYPTLELCKSIEAKEEPHGIANLCIRSKDGNVEQNQTRNFIQDIDEIPFPDREMWKPWIHARNDDELAVLLGRGCPYGCTYCSNHAIKKVAEGKYVRMRSPENILKELEVVRNDFPYNRVYFEVESIALDKSWTFELCDQLKTFNKTINNSLSYGCNFRISPQSMDETIFIAFKEANFYRINIGLESGSERIRRKLLKRHYSNDDFLKVVSMAREHGLEIFVFNLIGVPGESLREHMETVQLNRQSQPDHHFTGIFYPYPGTELHDYCIEHGLITDEVDTQMERRQAVIDMPNFSKAQIQKAYTWFNYRVYKDHKPLWIIMNDIINIKLEPYPKLRHLYNFTLRLSIVRYMFRGVKKLLSIFGLFSIRASKG